MVWCFQDLTGVGQVVGHDFPLRPERVKQPGWHKALGWERERN